MDNKDKIKFITISLLIMIYRIMVIGYLLLFPLLTISIINIRKRIMASNYYKSFDTSLAYIKDAFFEVGSVLGIILFTSILVHISYGNTYTANYYFGFKTRDLPHLLEAIPYLTSGYLLWSAFDLRRGKIKDYLTLIAVLAWLAFTAFVIFILIVFYDADFSHMP